VELVPVGFDDPTDDEAGDILTAREAAAFLRVGRNCVYELAARQAIPHQRVGKHLRFSRDALVQWLSSCGRSQSALKGH
jgi:excisionase family DNA binding protein